MTFSAQRERETLDACDSIVRTIDALTAEIAKGPRLTTATESERDSALHQIKTVYSNLAAHCRANLF